jgi:hypothetical protein
LLSNLDRARALLPMAWKHQDITAGVRMLLCEIGYPNPMVYQSPGLLGVPSELYYRSSRQLMLTDLVGGSARRTVGEWQEEWGEQSNDSLVTFLFANAEADFTRESV